MGHNVLIVGGASGIGKETAEAYIAAGHNVTIFDVNNQSINLMREVYFENDKVLFVQGDVKNNKDIDKVFNGILRTFGVINILIYSAAIFPDHNFLEMKEEEWDNVLDVNLKGAFLFGQKTAESMVENQIAGHIIMISSGSYRSSRVGSAHYCTSKAGLVMLTKTMAMELAAYGIKVNSVAPGLIDNPILNPEYKNQFVNRIPAGRIGKPSDISSFILSLTSLDNTYLTGQVIAIDGALSTGQYGLGMSNK